MTLLPDNGKALVLGKQTLYQFIRLSGKKNANQCKPMTYLCLRYDVTFWDGMCTLFLLPAPTPALDLHAHTQWHCLLLLGQTGGG